MTVCLWHIDINETSDKLWLVVLIWLHMIHSVMAWLRRTQCTTPLCAVELICTLSKFCFSQEMCDEKQNFTMCPLCDRVCDYWDLSTACGTARASHLFDNPATVFFAIFMSLWGRHAPLHLHLKVLLPSFSRFLLNKFEHWTLNTASAFPCSDECKTQVTGCGSKQICWCVSMEMEIKKKKKNLCVRYVWEINSLGIVLPVSISGCVGSRLHHRPFSCSFCKSPLSFTLACGNRDYFLYAGTFPGVGLGRWSDRVYVCVCLRLQSCTCISVYNLAPVNISSWYHWRLLMLSRLMVNISSGEWDDTSPQILLQIYLWKVCLS